MVQEQKQEIGLWRVATILAAVLTIPQIFFYPLSSDTAGLQWVALRLVRHGLLPYVGTWEPNFPGILAFHVPAVLLFGNSEIGFRVIEVLFQFVTIAALFRLSSHWLSSRAAFFACFSFMICTIHSGFLFYGQRDVFATGLLIIAMDAWFREEAPTVRGIILEGVALGLAALIRPFYLLLPMILFAISWRRISNRDRINFWLGVLTPGLLSLIPYVLSGTLGSYYDGTIQFLSLYASVVKPPLRDLRHVLLGYTAVLLFVGCAIIPAKLWPVREVKPMDIEKPLDGKDRLLFILMLTVVLLIIIAQHRFLMYHFAPLFAILSPLAGAGMERTIRMARKGVIRTISIWAIPVLLLIFYTPFLSIVSRAATISWNHPQYGGSFLDRPDPIDFRAMDDSVILYLQQPENSLGAVEVCSYDARLRMRLEREPASRFTYFQAFTITDSHAGHPPFQRAWQQEFLHALHDKPARFVILNGYMAFWMRDPPQISLPKDFPELDSLLRTAYTKDTTFGSYDIYRINSFTPSISSGN